MFKHSFKATVGAAVRDFFFGQSSRFNWSVVSGKTQEFKGKGKSNGYKIDVLLVRVNKIPDGVGKIVSKWEEGAIELNDGSFLVLPGFSLPHFVMKKVRSGYSPKAAWRVTQKFIEERVAIAKSHQVKSSIAYKMQVSIIDNSSRCIAELHAEEALVIDTYRLVRGELCYLDYKIDTLVDDFVVNEKIANLATR